MKRSILQRVYPGPLAWAVYLGMSWTWCIGMFLPVILVSEYGVGAWAVFAVPNVLGAAAMGWVLTRPGSSERLVTEHRTACVAFSAVTLAFHAYFLLWLSCFVQSPIIPGWYALLAVIVGTGLGFFRRRSSSLELVIAPLILLVSLVVLGKGLSHLVLPDLHGAFPQQTPVALLSLSPACFLGFLLCPYLDLTFHRARQACTPAQAKIAFGVGFGFFFLLMILLTLVYQRDLFGDAGSFGAGVACWVGLHMAVQIGFTWAAHLRALPPVRWKDSMTFIAAAVMVITGVALLQSSEWFGNQHYPYLDKLYTSGQRIGRQMLTGDLVYRLFMSFYGLVFPAYVWICMVPLAGYSPGPRRQPLLVCALATAVAAPLFWLGFIEEKMWLLPPAVIIVLFARLLVNRTDDLPDHVARIPAN